MAVSAESMTASAPSNTAAATSLASARVGRVDSTIDCSISVATITGRLLQPATADDLLLHDRHPLGRELHPEIAARHHHGVRRGDHLPQVLDRVRRLDLGHDRRRRPPCLQTSRSATMSSARFTNDSAT